MRFKGRVNGILTTAMCCSCKNHAWFGEKVCLVWVKTLFGSQKKLFSFYTIAAWRLKKGARRLGKRLAPFHKECF